jgi:GxxExxY protein
MEDERLSRDLSRHVVEAVFEVHHTLGPGFAEGTYEEALAYEFEMRGIPFERQRRVTVHYKGHVVDAHCLNFIVDDKIAIELKAVSALTDTLRQQTLSYLKAVGLRLGILVNFGTPRVEYVHIAN